MLFFKSKVGNGNKFVFIGLTATANPHLKLTIVSPDMRL